MKKCASCTKDLPDAALHCVFCGAKQPPAPAVQQGLAKTAFGYSANEVAEQMRRGPQPAFPSNPPPPSSYAPPPAPPPPAFTPPSPQQPGPSPYGATVAQAGPFTPPRTPPGPTPGPPMNLPYQQGPSNPPPGFPPNHGPGAPPQPRPGLAPATPGSFVPASTSSAPTMFVQGGPSQGSPVMQPPAQPAFVARNPPPPQQAATLLAPPPLQPQQMPQAPMQAPPMQVAPMMPIPRSQPPPYLASHTASRLGRPVEPWKDSLRQVMFLWGVLLLIVFVVPLQTSEMRFHWNQIIDAAGTAKLPSLLIAAIGILSAVVAPIPMQPAARGMIAAVLGLAGMVVPIALVGLPPWQYVVPLAATLLLVPSLLLRSEYRDALLPRLLITIGVLAMLVLYLLPDHGTIPLIGMFKSIVDLPGKEKLPPALALGHLVVVLMTLLAWLPSPVTGGAKVWAWLLVLWGLILHVNKLVAAGDVLARVKGAPNEALVAWIGGGGLALGAAYLVLFSYGLASVIGKQLE